MLSRSHFQLPLHIPLGLPLSASVSEISCARAFKFLSRSHFQLPLQIPLALPLSALAPDSIRALVFSFLQDSARALRFQLQALKKSSLVYNQKERRSGRAEFGRASMNGERIESAREGRGAEERTEIQIPLHAPPLSFFIFESSALPLPFRSSTRSRRAELRALLSIFSYTYVRKK